VTLSNIRATIMGAHFIKAIDHEMRGQRAAEIEQRDERE
jgi:hypothetical protein